MAGSEGDISDKSGRSIALEFYSRYQVKVSVLDEVSYLEQLVLSSQAGVALDGTPEVYHVMEPGHLNTVTASDVVKLSLIFWV